MTDIAIKIMVIMTTACLVMFDIAKLITLLAIGWPLLLIAGTPRAYIINNLIAIDMGVNAECGGDPDETISSRLGKDRNNSHVALFFAKIVDVLFFWDKGPNGEPHTIAAIEPCDGSNKIL